MLTSCECDNTHAQNHTVCRFCWAKAIKDKAKITAVQEFRDDSKNASGVHVAWYPENKYGRWEKKMLRAERLSCSKLLKLLLGRMPTEQEIDYTLRLEGK